MDSTDIKKKLTFTMADEKNHNNEFIEIDRGDWRPPSNQK
jgi:hypothetical protein